MPGSRTIEVLLALVLAGGLGYIVSRSVAARRRGDDVGAAAAGALRTIGPPVILAVVGLVALSIVAAFAGIVLLLALFSALAGDGDAGAVILLWFGALGVLCMAVVGAIGWGLIRVLRAGRNR